MVLIAGFFVFQSTPFARRETRESEIYAEVICVSIHSLRKKGDICYSEIPILNDVSIHSLRKKGDDSQEQDYAMIFTFQSTPFARRET